MELSFKIIATATLVVSDERRLDELQDALEGKARKALESEGFVVDGSDVVVEDLYIHLP